ncbi:MAG: YHYH domain-containing protein [Deltaproteobacteria bacterium]|nr:YHYH domain-containing protein [Deltaproteobacteria bacterium]
MTRRLLLALAAAMPMLLAPALEAHSGGTDSNGCHTNTRTGEYHCHGAKASSAARPRPAQALSGGSGPASGAVKRSAAAKTAFRRTHPCPSTGKIAGACPGYHVDHVKPLACGGIDDPSNMQWLTAAENLRKGSMGCRR